MGDSTGIEWTDATWNPVTGCTKVSQGCKHCYAERDWNRLAHLPAYQGRAFTDVACHPKRLDQPLRWKRPRRIFVNSMSDLFHEDVPFEFIEEVHEVIRETERHTFQILTKRPDRMVEFWKWRKEVYFANSCTSAPPRNAWYGVSVEDQSTADYRVPLLLQTPAAVRWISAEPLLGPVSLVVPFDGARVDAAKGARPGIPGLDWVVVGGESGPKARPMHPDWARSLRDQCAAAGVPFFMKQLHDDTGKLIKDISTLPSDLQIREYPNAYA
jgi:protein gp37